MAKAKCMQDLSIFSGLDIYERQKVAQLARKKLYRAGEVVFNQGEPADSIYLIKTGKIKLFKVSESGKEMTLDILHADDIYGEAHLFEENEQPFTAQALEDTFICSCTKKDFQQLISENPSIAIKLVENLGKKLNQYTQRMASMAFEDVKGRLIKILMQLAVTYGTDNPKGTKINLPLTHQDLAALVNASRVMVTNTLQKLRQEGIIDYQNRYYILTSKAVLQFKSNDL